MRFVEIAICPAPFTVAVTSCSALMAAAIAVEVTSPVAGSLATITCWGTPPFAISSIATMSP
ncbi:hypothetical protein N9151_01190, partial [bacterium]|nr:hypothetical protein [bacterium]